MTGPSTKQQPTTEATMTVQAADIVHNKRCGGPADANSSYVGSRYRWKSSNSSNDVQLSENGEAAIFSSIMHVNLKQHISRLMHPYIEIMSGS